MKITGDWIEAAETQAVCAMLTDAGHQALFVGGCVRNALLGVPVSDIDISTDARPNEVMRLAEAAGFRPVPTGIDHGTVTVVVGEAPFEITTFRRDVDTDGRRAVVAFANDSAEDALRRDFTMNALYARPDGTVLDPLGQGLADLGARRFRFIEDADRRIQEDYLRSLRFFRFHAVYSGAEAGFEPETLDAIARNVDGLTTLSRERVGAEMLKLLGAKAPAPAVAAMRNTGVLQAILPGTDDTALGPLCHIEAEAGIAPDPMRRLAALGGADVADRLRLSKAESKRLALLQDLIGSAMPAHEMGYRYGEETGCDVLLLRAALSGTMPDTGALTDLRRGAAAEFPLKADDLQPGLEGVALGQALKQAKSAWLESDFSLSRDDLLARFGQP